ncbi:NERD domain-containing protein [Streptomyces sp. NPDC091272]|uniref:NERD domain-containing protein n=1 Tax=Streptomyces sp. NPDC091272 TaxID=3365981 RepID=UPI003822E987
MEDGRRTTVTESGYEHERRGLEAIRKRLPDEEPWRAWSNFTFTASSGHVREVDLMVTAPAGVFLIELKDWHGSVSGGGNSWMQTTPGGTQRRHGNPLHLTNQKAKELASLIGDTVGRGHGRPRIWVSEAVCFTDDKLGVNLASADMNGVYTIKQLVEMLSTPPTDARRQITATVSRQVDAALKQLRIAPVRRQHEVFVPPGGEVVRLRPHLGRLSGPSHQAARTGAGTGLPQRARRFGRRAGLGGEGCRP